jgi:predicted transcriptional regulator
MEKKRNQTKLVERKEQAVGSEAEKKMPNNVRKIREALLLSKAELARKAGVSALTVDRIEAGYNCRMDTKRKIILALGMKLSDKDRVFGNQQPDEEPEPR